MRSIWNTQHADESSASVGICQINILRFGLREKNRFPVSAIHNNASLSLSFVLFSHYFHFRHFRFCIILILVVILNYDGTALYGISRAYCGGGDALPLHSETYFGNGIKGPLVLRLIKQLSTFYSYN